MLFRSPEFEDFGNDRFAVITISVDDFHKNNIEKALDFYKKYANKYVLIETQNDWNVSVNDGNSIPLMEYRNSELDWVRNTGRAKDTGIGFLETECEYNGVNCCNLCHRIHVDDGVVQCRRTLSRRQPWQPVPGPAAAAAASFCWCWW